MIDGNNDVSSLSDEVEIGVANQQYVNVVGPIKIGDRLVISNIPGKARAYSYLEDLSYIDLRTIGKVIQFTDNKDQVVALLDIE